MTTERIDVLAEYRDFLTERARLARNPDVKLAYEKAANRFANVQNAMAELIEAVNLDAVDKAIESGLGASEWRAFLSPREAPAIARVGGAA